MLRLLKRFQNICDAVAFAHSKGIIHRDLKPDNVILGQYGETLVIDWGLAKAVGSTEERVGGDTPSWGRFVTCLGEAGRLETCPTKRLSGTDTDETHTHIGDVLGTPAFMPPEQAAGRLDELGPAADIYSLGATLYVILVGRSPVEGAKVSEVLDRARNGRITPPRQANPSVPAALEAVCLKAMSRKPQDRYASAKELAAEVDCWLADEPVSAYREPLRVRLARWRRHHRALVTGTAALLFTALLSVAVGAWLLSREQERTLSEHKAKLRAQGAEIESQKNTEKARQDHALAQVDALFSASPGAVPLILENLEPFRERVVPRLREVLDRAAPLGVGLDAVRRERQHRTRAALALLKDDSGQVPFLVEWMLEDRLDPEETLLIRDQLAAHGKDLAGRLWEEARKPGAGPERRLRALVALAAFDPDEKRWADAGKDVVGPLLAAEPLHAGVWRKGLEPVRRHLIAPLTDAFSPTGSRWSSAERRMATGLLRDYAQDEVDTLATLILTADAEQFAALLPAFRSHGEKAVALMHRELDRIPLDWKDAPLDRHWTAPSAEVLAAVERAHGVVAERFALCQTLALEKLKPVTESLRECGYRPAKARPYAAGGTVQVAVVWQRDGRDWRLDVGLTADEVKERQDERKKAGLIPADVAGYRTEGESRFTVLWVKAGSQNEDAGLYVDVPYERHRTSSGIRGSSRQRFRRWREPRGTGTPASGGRGLGRRRSGTRAGA